MDSVCGGVRRANVLYIEQQRGGAGRLHRDGTIFFLHIFDLFHAKRVGRVLCGGLVNRYCTSMRALL